MAVALLVLSSVLVGAVYPMIVEQFSVKPNAAQKESTYIERNIEATRQAYGITEENVTTSTIRELAPSSPRTFRQTGPRSRTHACWIRPFCRRRSPLSVSSRTSTGSRRRSTSIVTNKTASCATSLSPRVSCRRTTFPATRRTGSTSTRSTRTATVSSPPRLTKSRPCRATVRTTPVATRSTR